MNALILVCALSISAEDCHKQTSIHQFYAPEPQNNLAGCMMQGMLYAAESGLVEPGTYSKIVCIPPGRVVAQNGTARRAAGVN